MCLLFLFFFAFFKQKFHLEGHCIKNKSRAAPTVGKRRKEVRKGDNTYSIQGSAEGVNMIDHCEFGEGRRCNKY